MNYLHKAFTKRSAINSVELKDIKSEIGAPTRAKQRERNKLAENDIKGKEGRYYNYYTCDRRKARLRRRRAHDLPPKALRKGRLQRQKKKTSTDEKCV